MDILLLVLIAAFAAIVLWRWTNQSKPPASKPSHSDAETVVSAPQGSAFKSNYGFKSVEEESSQQNATWQQQRDALMKFCRERHTAILSVMVDYAKSKHCRGVYFEPKFPATTYWIRQEKSRPTFDEVPGTRGPSLAACVLVRFNSAFETDKSNPPLEIEITVNGTYFKEVEKLGEALAEAVGLPGQTYRVSGGSDIQYFINRIDVAENNEPQTAFEL